ncbi:hypothetical protein LZ30DRAFT_7344 [Colletotrichum cereale]|nr:hypothetical protein LZ30DRAFT_7344 [Colletotrichum cereale]
MLRPPSLAAPMFRAQTRVFHPSRRHFSGYQSAVIGARQTAPSPKHKARAAPTDREARCAGYERTREGDPSQQAGSGDDVNLLVRSFAPFAGSTCPMSRLGARFSNSKVNGRSLRLSLPCPSPFALPCRCFYTISGRSISVPDFAFVCFFGLYSILYLPLSQPCWNGKGILGFAPPTSPSCQWGPLFSNVRTHCMGTMR